MSTPRPSSLYGKRGACERCRGQKLRCIREDQGSNSPQATCVRCFKAGAICSYGTAKRAGRFPASDTSSPQGRRANGHGKPKMAGMASRPTADPSGQSGFRDGETGTWQGRRGSGNWSSGRLLEEYTVDQESERGTEDTTPMHGHSPPSLHDSFNVLSDVHLDFPACSASSIGTLPWTDEAVMSFSCQDAEEASGLEPFGSKDNWTFHHYHAKPMDIQVPTISPNGNGEQHGDVGVNGFGTHAQACSKDALISGASDEAMDIDLLTTSALTASFSPTPAVDARPRRDGDNDSEWALLSESSGMNAPANLPLFTDLAKQEGGTKLDGESLHIDKFQHRRMQELSKLAMDLYAQLATNDPENFQPPSGGTGTAFQDQLIGNVLRSSNTFLTLLSSFSTPASPSSPSPLSPPASSRSGNNHPSDPSDRATSPTSSALDHHDHAAAVQSPPRKRPAPGADDLEPPPPPPPIDMATVLQLLTCYIRVVHLHGLMHARILHYMFACLQHPTHHHHLHLPPVPPVFPDMQVGGVSLNRFGTFQINLLLQISVHVLGEIEAALGLSHEFRVGESKGGSPGVLGANVSAEFVRCLMSEGAWRGRKFESVREQLADLRGVLKRAMAF